MTNYYNDAPRPKNDFIPDYLRQIKTNDRDFIDRWLYATKYSKNRASGRDDMFDARRAMLEVLDACAKMKDIEGRLRTNVAELNDDAFREKFKEIDRIKANVVAKMSILRDDSLMTQLKTKLSRRCNERRRLRRRKNEIKAQRAIRRRSNDAKSKEIDEWLEEKKVDIRNKRKESDLKIKTEEVSRDVGRRKAEARRNVSLLDALLNLREAREKSANGRGERIDAADKQIFKSSIEKLKLLWSNAMTKYESEEKKLKASLRSDCETVPIIEPSENKAVSIINEWKYAMFGDSEMLPQRNFNGNVYHFISIRQRWDQYVSFDTDGSRIPFGWLKPSPLTDGWKEYLEK